LQFSIYMFPYWNVSLHNLTLGLVIEAKTWKGVNWKCKPESHFCTPRNVREWTHTLPNGLPLWELESLWSPKSSKKYFRGQNSLDQKVPYTIEKLLKRKCPKWACMTHLSTLNTSYGQKKGWESKCQFDSYSLKVCNCPKINV
jgi:hypothetical protein